MILRNQEEAVGIFRVLGVDGHPLRTTWAFPHPARHAQEAAGWYLVHAAPSRVELWDDQNRVRVLPYPVTLEAVLDHVKQQENSDGSPPM